MLAAGSQIRSAIMGVGSGGSRTNLIMPSSRRRTLARPQTRKGGYGNWIANSIPNAAWDMRRENLCSTVSKTFIFVDILTYFSSTFIGFKQICSSWSDMKLCHWLHIQYSLSATVTATICPAPLPPRTTWPSARRSLSRNVVIAVASLMRETA